MNGCAEKGSASVSVLSRTGDTANATKQLRQQHHQSESEQLRFQRPAAKNAVAHLTCRVIGAIGRTHQIKF
ncbi:hypothetical protein niasHT_001579 [Heterodera trifolii]|uniref:Uncharacterized protein n=1 Tax=Heterodera trifolii TaxID=157864 RepID=A0ABD2MB39_9BILA